MASGPKSQLLTVLETSYVTFFQTIKNRTYASNKRNLTAISCSARIKRARRARQLKVVSDAKDMQPHEPFGPRQKKEIQKSVKDVTEDYWSIIAPTHPGVLIMCISDIGFKLGSDSQDTITKLISQA